MAFYCLCNSICILCKGVSWINEAPNRQSGLVLLAGQGHIRCLYVDILSGQFRLSNYIYSF